MEDIVDIRKKFESEIAKRSYGVKNKSDLDENQSNIIGRSSEIKALIHKIIPENCRNLTMKDFTGKHKGEVLLSNDSANEVKKKIIEYCYGKDISLELFNSLSGKDLSERTIMDKRRRIGTNVIICSDQYTNQKSGKTFVASLIMREAILILGRRSGFLTWEYDWKSFSTIENLMRDGDAGHSISCDWLVVDDILGLTKTKQAESYTAGLIDPFFQYRLTEGLPTILVFRFNVLETIAVEEKFGVAIGKMVNDPKAMVISL